MLFCVILITFKNKKTAKILTTRADMIWGAMSQNALEQDSGSSQLARSLMTVTAEKTSCDTKQFMSWEEGGLVCLWLWRAHNILTAPLSQE